MHGETYPLGLGTLELYILGLVDGRSKSGVWERIFEQLAADADNEYAMIDSTIVRAHQHSAGAKGGSQTPKQLVEAKEV